MMQDLKVNINRDSDHYKALKQGLLNTRREFISEKKQSYFEDSSSSDEEDDEDEDDDENANDEDVEEQMFTETMVVYIIPFKHIRLTFIENMMLML